MDHYVFASIGFIAIGCVATALIYLFGARKLLSADPANYDSAMRWTFAFAISICTFCGLIPFLAETGVFLLALPLCGIGLSLDSITRIVSSSDAIRKPIA